MNVIRNKAAALKADTVYLLTNRAANTGSSNGLGGGSSQQTSTVLIGNAYKCNK